MATTAFASAVHLFQMSPLCFNAALRGLVLLRSPFYSLLYFLAFPATALAFSVEKLLVYKTEGNRLSRRDLYYGARPPNAAPFEYMDFLMNNRDVQVPSFSASAHKCEGVFETLNMITRMLLQKYINQSVPQHA